VTTPEPADPSLEAHATTIRVVNGSAEMHARVGSCTGPEEIGIRPAAVQVEPPVPTCRRIDCSTLSSGEALARENECTGVACAPLRVDLAPGAADADYAWDGVYRTLSERNCYTPTIFEPGTPMLAHVCFGRPDGDYDLLDVTCSDHPFAYGTPLLEIELE